MSYVDPSGCAVAPPARPRRRGHRQPFDRAHCYRELRLSLGWSQGRIAALCGVSTQTVARALRAADAAPPGDGRPEAPGRPLAPRTGLTAAELEYVRQTYGAEPIVREWLLEAGLA